MESKTSPLSLKISYLYLVAIFLSFSVFFAIEKAYKILPLIYFIAAVLYLIKERPSVSYKVVVFYLSAVLFVIIGDLFNIYFGHSDFSGIEQVARNLVLAVPLIVLLNNEKLSVNRITFAVFIMLCVTAIASILQFYSIYAHESPHFNGQRIGLWWNPVVFANSIVFFMALLLGSAVLIQKSHTTNIMIALACVLLLIIVYLSGTRSALLSYFVVVLIYFIINVLEDKRFWYRCLIAAVALFLLSMSMYFFGDRISLALDELYRHFQEGPEHTSVSIRLSSWHYSWLIFLDNPLFGNGISGAKVVGKGFVDAGIIPEYIMGYHAHSDVFDALKRNGLFGFFGLLWVYISPFMLMWYFKLSVKSMAPVFMVVLALLISGLTEINIRHNVSANSFYMAYMLALAVVFKAKSQREKIS